ncbi:MAG TPA: alpha/beta hydrolase [Nevskia sp.]|nr:alpha/beta hydrolase [Nevskia sp.]
MPIVTTRDQTSLYYKDWGSGPAVIFLHGWPLSADSWDDQAMAIAEAGYRTIAYDRRGFGRSSQPWVGYDYGTLADDLADVIAHGGVSDVTLVGFSMGGGEIARYLTRHGRAAISRVALISSVVPYMPKTDDNPDGTNATVFAEMAQSMTADRAAFFEGFFRDFFGVSLISHPVGSELLRWCQTVAMQASLKATLECAKSFATTDFRPDLASFDLPTLIIHGTADKTVPIDAAGRAAARGIPQARLIEYPGAPHGLFATDKSRLTLDLLEFLGHAPTIAQSEARRQDLRDDFAGGQMQAPLLIAGRPFAA